jgi:archaemetzincin
LSPAFYGLPEAPELFFQRVTKETLHELGHVFGLEHCKNSCVMRFSNSLNDTDRKPESFCPSCLSRLRG